MKAGQDKKSSGYSDHHSIQTHAVYLRAAVSANGAVDRMQPVPLVEKNSFDICTDCTKLFFGLHGIKMEGASGSQGLCSSGKQSVSAIRQGNEDTIKSGRKSRQYCGSITL